MNPARWMVLLVAAILAALAVVTTCTTRAPTDATAIEDTKTWLQAAQAYHTTAQKLQTVAAVHRAAARATEDTAQHLLVQAEADTIPCVVFLPACPAEDLSLRSQRDSAFRAADTYMRAAHLFALADYMDSTRADSLQALLAAGVRPVTRTLAIADCHVFGASWLPACPSRTHAFLAGAILATGLTLYLTHR